MSTAEPPTRLDTIYAAPVWMMPPERVVLYSTVYGLRPRRSLEIGTFRGGSAMIIVAALDDIGEGSLTCIDPNPQIEPGHLRHIEHRATVHAVPSPDGLAALVSAPEDRFEFALIDGDHSYEGVIRDIEGVLGVLAENAVLLFHDAHFYDVADAIDAMLVRHADRLVDCGMVSTLQAPEPESQNGRPVIWGGLRMLRFAPPQGPATAPPSRPRATAAPRKRVEEARHQLETGDARFLALPSRFGAGGHAARAILRRVAQPLTVRQRQIDEQLLAAIEELSLKTPRGGAAAAATGAPAALDPASIVDVQTEHGPLFVHAGDEVMTPFLEQHRFWEPAETRFIAATLRPGQFLLDVGANFGYFSILGSKIVGPEGTVIAVEPEPRNVALLRANLWRNGAHNAVVLPIAAARRRGYLPLRSCEENRGDHRVGLQHAGSSALVPAARLDEVLADSTVDFAKIDTQGMDHDVIAGLEGLLAASPGLVVMCEFWLTGMEERGVDAGGVLRGYQALGFKLALLDEHGVPQPAASASVLAAAAAEGSRFVNIVLTR